MLEPVTLAAAQECEADIRLNTELVDVLAEWARIREFDDGCLLVRSDRHVAWRSLGMVDDPAATLRSAISSVLAGRVLDAARLPTESRSA